MQAFSTALASGALASVTTLRLYNNQIGDVGMRAFSTALAGGALASVTTFTLHLNQISDAVKKVL